MPAEHVGDIDREGTVDEDGNVIELACVAEPVENVDELLRPPDAERGMTIFPFLS